MEEECPSRDGDARTGRYSVLAAPWYPGTCVCVTWLCGAGDDLLCKCGMSTYLVRGLGYIVKFVLKL